jgi:hypothetical protein
MRELLEVFLVIVGGCAIISGLVTGLAFQRVRRANRVSLAMPCDAPLRWMWSPGRPAQLHRRLRRATRMVDAATSPLTPPARRHRNRRAGEGGVLDATGRELVRRAVTLDGRLVACDRGGPSWRRQQLAELAREVSTLESSAARLASLSIDLRRHLDETAGASGGSDIELGLDALEAAIGELRRTPDAARRPAP